MITTEFVHPVDVVWTLFSDPAKLARWWGPPGLPMSVDRHELRPGGGVEVTVTTEGGEIRAQWTIHEVDAPRRLAFTFRSDGLDEAEITVDITAASATAATMVLTARFTSERSLQHALDIGFDQGLARSCAAAPQVLASDARR